MEHIELTVAVEAPAQKVWDAITNWEAQNKWMLGTKVWPDRGVYWNMADRIPGHYGNHNLGCAS
jgi:uncharacterized protein YndB with AHSA1/START domain